MSTQAITNVSEIENEFIEAFKHGIEYLEKAGKALIALVEKDKDARGRLVEKYGFDHATLATLERVGRGSLHAKLAMFGLKYAALPMSEQKKIAEEKVDVLVMKGNGDTDVLKVSLLRASPTVRKQVLASDHVRTLDEQRQYLAGQNRPIAPAGEQKMPWSVSGRKVVVHASNTDKVFTRSDLLSMMKAMEG